MKPEHLYSEPHLSTTAAWEALSAAIGEARRLGVAICCAVVDRRGELVAFLRMDGTPPAAAEFARRKAITAVLTRRPTDEVAERLRPDGDMAGYFTLPNICVFPGGVPVAHQGLVVGAIGVSGSSGEIDVRCARAGAERLATRAGSAAPGA